MTIYAVRSCRSPYYRELDFDVMDIINSKPKDLHMDDILEAGQRNTAMAEWWTRPDVVFQRGNEPIPDISVWIDSTLLLSPKAYRFLFDMLKDYGEFLPILVESEEYFLFNCLTFCEEDPAYTNGEYQDDQLIMLTRLRFADSAEKSTLFKSSMEQGLTPYCNNCFKDAVEAFELKGLFFDENLIEQY